MSHPRTEIRDAVAALLIGAVTVDDVTTYATNAGARVAKTRVAPWRLGELPAIAVYTGSDSVDIKSQQRAPRKLERKCELTVEIAALHTVAVTVEDALDALEVQVLRALGADPTLGDKFSDCILLGSEIEIFEEGKRFVGTLKMQFDVFYEQAVPDSADVVLNDLKSVHTNYDLAGSQETADQASDIIEGLDEA